MIAVQLYHLRTARGNFLIGGSPLVEMGDEQDPRKLVAISPQLNRQIVFLASPKLGSVQIRGDSMVGPAISAFRLQTHLPGIMRLRHPLAPHRFAAVTQPGSGGPNGVVIFDSPGIGTTERFTNSEVDTSLLTPYFMRLVDEICAATTPPWDAETLLNRMRQLVFRPSLTETLIRVLPWEELSQLARLVMENAEDLSLLRRAMPRNPWFAQVLPSLHAWHERPDRSPRVIVHSTIADEFASDPFEGHDRPQAGFAINGLARARIRPSKGPCLLTTVRNEGPYLLEWLAYHRSIGFEHAFVYTNDNQDSSEHLLELLASHGVITLVNNDVGQRCAAQNKMHAHALSILPDILDYRWAALIDADEFLAFDVNKFSSVSDILAWHETQPVDALALCWLVFGARLDDIPEDRPTLLRFTHREPSANFHVKPLFRPTKFCNARAHFPFPMIGSSFIFRSEFGGIHHYGAASDRDASFATHPSAESVWINHYWLRTGPELLWKIARGHPDGIGATEARFVKTACKLFGKFVQLTQTDLVEDRRILACANTMPTELARLRSLPGVVDAETVARQYFTTRLPKLVEAFLNGAPKNGIEFEEFTQFRTLLQSSENRTKHCKKPSGCESKELSNALL